MLKPDIKIKDLLNFRTAALHPTTPMNKNLDKCKKTKIW